MRTRRSPRNQEILWRALGGPPAPAARNANGIESLERQFSNARPRDRKMIEREIARARSRAVSTPSPRRTEP